MLAAPQHKALRHRAAATDGARLTIRPMPCATALLSAWSARLITSVTISTGSNCWRTTASASPALKGRDLLGQLHFASSLRNFSTASRASFSAVSPSTRCDRRRLVAEGQIILPDIGGEQLSDLLHGASTACLAKLLQHRRALTELHQRTVTGVLCCERAASRPSADRDRRRA